jgi:2-(1,2-epoxy-1,2-dihydrophenyl)acetyl-CoA isomerase
MNNSFIQLQISNGVGVITLNRPEKYNSFVREMALQMQQALQECSSNKLVRAVLINAAGKAFCAGQDLAEAVDPAAQGIAKIVEENYNPIILQIREMPKPVICAVHGAAAGAGANIALAADIVVAANNANFIQAFSKIGLVPDSGGTYMLPRLVGFQRAMALMFLGDKVSATEALKMGMIYKVVEDDKLAEEALNIATTLANMPTMAFAYTKELLNKSMHNTLREQLTLEGVLQEKAANTNDFREGVAAFLEKRLPIFKGE